MTTNTIDVTSMKDSLASVSASASFRVVSNSILISAALLPSLRVEYKVRFFDFGISRRKPFCEEVKEERNVIILWGYISLKL